MPKFRVLKTSWLDLADPQDPKGASPRLVKPGEIIDFHGRPGTSLEPIDDEKAKRLAAAAAADAGPHTGVPSRSEMDALLARINELEGKKVDDASPSDPSTVEIAADWQSYDDKKRRQLAISLGASHFIKTAAVNDFISAEVAKRAKAPPKTDPVPAPRTEPNRLGPEPNPAETVK